MTLDRFLANKLAMYCQYHSNDCCMDFPCPMYTSTGQKQDSPVWCLDVEPEDWLRIAGVSTNISNV